MFLSPWGLMGFLAIPLILILYILKQRKEKHSVSSLILWRQVLQDMQARTPWQKLRKNLLMFLQILSALLIVLSLAGLALRQGNRAEERVLLVMDSSLSMSSTDVEPSRLEEAKKDAVHYIETLPRDSRVTIINAAGEAVVLLYDSSQKEEIKRTIQAIENSYTFLDKAKAEALLLSLKKSNPEAGVVLFGDTPLTVGNEDVQFSNYRKQDNNLAIVRFTHTRVGEQIAAMSIIRNQGEEEAEISVSLYGDDLFLDAQRLRVPGNGTQTVWWKGFSSDVKIIRCTIDTEDILMADNHAVDAVSQDTMVKILLTTEGNLFLEKAFSLIDGVELVRTLPEEMTDYNGYDLYLFDGYFPQKLPNDGNIIVFNPPSNTLFPVGDWMDTPHVMPVVHPLFQYLERMHFSIGRTRIMESPEAFEVIMESNGNPVIMEGEFGNARMLVFGFNLFETDLPLRTEFPVMMSNILTEYAPGKGTQISDVLIGETVRFRLQPDTESARVILPDGTGVGVSPPMPPEPFVDTHTPGVYQLVQNTQEQAMETYFTVNLPDEWLSENKAGGMTEENQTVGTHIPLKPGGALLIIPLLLAVLIILVLEWWYYANRNYI